MPWFRKHLGRVVFADLLVAFIMGSPCALAQKYRHDFSLGKPRVWIYQRVYPFLDGVFQDVASTEVAPLVLNANAANASQMNAVQTSWSVGVRFGAAAQAQNALAQQKNQLMIANTQVQSQLLSEQAKITQQLLTATQQMSQAQEALAQLQAQPTPNPAQLAAAQATLSADTNNVASLNSQLALVKAQIPTTTPTFTAPSVPQPSAVTLPNQLTTETAPAGSPTAPNFPASKQMDNQVNLLWERLSRLVSTLAQADSLSKYQMVLAGFDVNLMPNRENKKVFAVEYKATAYRSVKSGVPPHCSKDPLVVDLFPSASAVNIVNNQYKDSRGAIGAALSWMGWGLNAAYNREHLQMSQALGQSAYITGYGAGTSTFGWAFGRNLTDKSVSPGKRTVFAVIAVPEGCSLLDLISTRAGWFGEKSQDWYSNDPKIKKRFQNANEDFGNIKVEDLEEKPTVLSVAYAPVEFDPTSAVAPTASIKIDFATSIDPEMEITVNSQIIPRARDTFARGVTSGGSGGMLESNSFTNNTWIATSSRTIVLSLDPSKFSRGFPDVAFISPSDVTPLNERELLPIFDAKGNLKVKGKSRGVQYIVSGQTFGCADPCESDLPPLGYRKATWQTLNTFRIKNGQGSDSKIVLSISSDVPNPLPSSTTAANVQVLTEAPSPWSGNVLVMAAIPRPDEDTNVSCTHKNSTKPIKPSIIRLSCHSMTSTVRLICSFPHPLECDLASPVTIELHDADHAGGPVSARATLRKDDGSKQFIVWSLQQPRWLTSDEKGSVPEYLVCAEFANDDGDGFALGTASGQPKAKLTFSHNLPECPSSAHLWSGGVKMRLDDYVSLTDHMTIVQLDSHGNSVGEAATLLNLHAAGEPMVNVASTDSLQWYGQNLIFGRLMQVGGGKAVAITCDPAGGSCQVMPPAQAKASKKTGGATPTPAPPPLGSSGGPIYMIYTNAKKSSFIIPVMKNTNGAIAPFQYMPPGGGGGGGNGGGGQLSFAMTMEANSKGATTQATQPTGSVATAKGAASSSTSSQPTVGVISATNPAKVSPMSVIVLQ